MGVNMDKQNGIRVLLIVFWAFVTTFLVLFSYYAVIIEPVVEEGRVITPFYLLRYVVGLFLYISLISAFFYFIWRIYLRRKKK